MTDATYFRVRDDSAPGGYRNAPLLLRCENGDPYHVIAYTNQGGTAVPINLQSIDQSPWRYGCGAPPFPAPWAWYRGDDLVGYVDGDPVTEWPDRAGGAGTLWHYFAGTTQYNSPVYDSTAIDAQPGISGVDPRELLAVQFAPATAYKQFDGLSVAVVVKSGEGYAWYQMDDATAVVYYRSTDGYMAFDGSGAYWETLAAPVTATGEALVLFVMTPTEVRGYLNGVLITPDSWYEPPDRALTGWRHLLPIRQDSKQAETIVWDRELTEAEAAEVWAYAQARYGL